MTRSIINKELIAKIDLKAPSVWLATWFGCGLLRPGPGTWGTLGGLPFGLLILYCCGWPGLLAASVLVFAIGYWAAARFDAMTGEHDNSAIVIDEVAGIWVTLLAVPPGLLYGPLYTSLIYAALAFALFRFFDILKPWPVSWCDKKLPGALGVMVDDIAAGIMAALCLIALQMGGQYAGFF